MNSEDQIKILKGALIVSSLTLIAAAGIMRQREKDLSKLVKIVGIQNNMLIDFVQVSTDEDVRVIGEKHEFDFIVMDLGDLAKKTKNL